jgi:uncharacterized integral membrane protein (TIGR00698 family)
MSAIEGRSDAIARSEFAAAPRVPVPHGHVLQTASIWPGLLLTAFIAGAGFALRQIPGVSTLSPLMLAILLGMAFHNTIGTPRWAKAGVTFSLRRLLRLAIILLGLQLTAAQIVEVGISGVAIIATTLVATFAFTQWLGHLMSVDWKLAQLIAAGTSICGASAVIATNTVTDADDEDVAYAVACVTVFGSIAMVVYPLFPALLRLDPHAYGLWAGASIHEIAQVAAATFQDGREAGEFGTIAKLSRVMLLAPTVIALGLCAARWRRVHGHVRGKAPMPWFVLGFVALVALNSFVDLPAIPKSLLVQMPPFLLTLALAAMGLETDIHKLRAKGLKPLLLGATSWLFIASFSLALVKFAS